MRSMNNIFDYLYQQRFKKGIVPTLDRITEIYQKLNLNIDNGKVITIAGTNGKGSTSAILTSILEAHGKKVCRFTSPHLYDITERFYFTDIKFINKTILESILIKIKKIVDDYQNIHPYHFITFFEYMLLGALTWFDSLNYDYIILEVGMGGRFDATNIIDAKYGAITSISLDHISYLGDTIEKIALEKSGIIKKNQTCVIGNLPLNAINIIENTAKKNNARIFYSDVISLGGFNIENSKLSGDYQKYNMKTAISLSNLILKKEFDVDSVSRGIRNAYWPARYEKISQNPIIIKDVAHNLEGILALKKNLEIEYENYKKIVIFTVMKDKDYEEILKVIDSFSDYNIFTSLDMERVLSPSVLKGLSNKESAIELKPLKALSEAIKRADKTSDTVIIITGSIFLMESLNFTHLHKREGSRN